MAQPYIGEIRMFAGNFAPAGWMFCQGQTLPISDNETLFQLIGTMYGGDGEQTFNLPDLQGRVPVHQGRSYSGRVYQVAESGGTENETLTTQQLPSHNHAMLASTHSADVASPKGTMIGISTTINSFIASVPSQSMAADILPIGGSQPHTNMHPYLCVNFIISLFGIFPSPS